MSSITSTLAAAVVAAPIAATQPFVLPEMPYAYDALEPHIDAKTMEIHHTRHHKAYVDNANAALEAQGVTGKTLGQILAEVSKYGAAVRNNGGGHYNHSLFWNLMAPAGKGGEPSKELLAAIDRDLGGLDAFKKAFADAAEEAPDARGDAVVRPALEKVRALAAARRDNTAAELEALRPGND